MWQLMRIEWFKLFKQQRTYWALAAILIIEGLVLVGAYFQGTEIIELLLENLRKSFYFKGKPGSGNCSGTHCEEEQKEYGSGYDRRY